ncbi:hypothetical protein GCM10010276_22360 [Streptomyces longisporus]|uniref:HNH endonuclease n=1 Tax=Streptomyces longisporus TaxID=1948 RepID=A0ABP5YND2_STRLO
MRSAELDHLISLRLGGDPNDYRNLWVEPADPGRKGSGVNNSADENRNAHGPLRSIRGASESSTACGANRPRPGVKSSK